MGFMIASIVVWSLALVIGGGWIFLTIKEETASCLSVFLVGGVTIGLAAGILSGLVSMEADKATDIRVVGSQTLMLKPLGGESGVYVNFSVLPEGESTKKIANYTQVNGDGSLSLSEIEAKKVVIKAIKEEEAPRLEILKVQIFNKEYRESPLREYESYQFFVQENATSNNLAINVNN